MGIAAKGRNICMVMTLSVNVNAYRKKKKALVNLESFSKQQKLRCAAMFDYNGKVCPTKTSPVNAEMIFLYFYLIN